MAKRKAKPSDITYTDEERKRFLYRTADEMRMINDKVDERYANNTNFQDDTECDPAETLTE